MPAWSWRQAPGCTRLAWCCAGSQAPGLSAQPVVASWPRRNIALQEGRLSGQSDPEPRCLADAGKLALTKSLEGRLRGQQNHCHNHLVAELQRSVPFAHTLAPYTATLSRCRAWHHAMAMSTSSPNVLLLSERNRTLHFTTIFFFAQRKACCLRCSFPQRFHW